jgi:hypothetical protein
MLGGFDFSTPSIASQLTGQLALLRRYNALDVPARYFAAAMSYLREKYLNVALDSVPHPASAAAQQATETQQAAASAAPAVGQEELTAQTWFEKGFNAVDLDEKVFLFVTSSATLMAPKASAISDVSLRRRARRQGTIDCLRRSGVRVAHPPKTGTPMRMGCRKIIAT